MYYEDFLERKEKNENKIHTIGWVVLSLNFVFTTLVFLVFPCLIVIIIPLFGFITYKCIGYILYMYGEKIPWPFDKQK